MTEQELMNKLSGEIKEKEITKYKTIYNQILDQRDKLRGGQKLDQ